MTPSLDAEPYKIRGAGPTQDVEQRGGVLQNPTQPERECREQHGITGRRSGNRDESGANALARAGGDDQRDDRTRRNNQHGGDDQKCGEQIPIHRSLLVHIENRQAFTQKIPAMRAPPSGSNCQPRQPRRQGGLVAMRLNGRFATRKSLYLQKRTSRTSPTMSASTSKLDIMQCPPQPDLNGRRRK